jgi:hypothetical protein
MELTNSTPLPAKVVVGALPDQQSRIGILVAKATYRFDLGGRVEIDTQDPFPLFDKDQDTPLGILPTDGTARRGPRFEVMLLGNAHPPRPPATVTKVALSVGKEQRELMVFGDRAWIVTSPSRRSIGNPAPYDLMPLVYERAFGGTTPVHIDRDTVVDIRDPINPRGKGFDAELPASSMCQALRAPKGFPRLPPTPRPLPNLENPRTLIARWEDQPDPVGWAATPTDTAIAHLKFIRSESAKVLEAQKKGQYDADAYQKELEARKNDDPDGWLYRAHPDWLIERPPAGALITMENLLPDARQLRFALPQLRVVADYTLAGRQGQRDLIPQVLVLLPEEKRFYLVYRMPFNFDPKDAQGRACRLRIEQGWLADT